MISGITPRPRPVTIQFLAVTATPGRALARPRPAPQHIRFIVKPAQDGQNKVYVKEYFLLTRLVNNGSYGKKTPGTITEAKACQSKVSIAAMATLLVSAPGSWIGRKLLMIVRIFNPDKRANHYLALFHSFIICVCKDVSWCHSICGAHPSMVEVLHIFFHRICNMLILAPVQEIPDMHKSPEGFPNLIGISKISQRGIPTAG